MNTSRLYSKQALIALKLERGVTTVGRYGAKRVCVYVLLWIVFEMLSLGGLNDHNNISMAWPRSFDRWHAELLPSTRSGLLSSVFRRRNNSYVRSRGTVPAIISGVANMVIVTNLFVQVRLPAASRGAYGKELSRAALDVSTFSII